MGAYFIAVRKTPLAIEFVRDWLAAMQDSRVSKVENIDSRIKDFPGFQRHMADQSALSVKFKQYGLKWTTLKEIHTMMALKR